MYWLKLVVVVLGVNLGGFSFAQGLTDEALDANGFPLSWQAQDFGSGFNFTMLEPAAGASSVSAPAPSAGATVPATAGLSQPQVPVRAGPVSPTTASPKSMTIDQMPRVSLAPSGSMALPAPLPLTPESALGVPLNQALPQTRAGGVAADLGIMVNEQTLAIRHGDLATLATYGPLAAGVAAPENAWAFADAATQAARLKAATVQPLQSMAMREAYRRLLLAQVAPPLASPNQPHWLAVRAEALETLGWYEAAWSLWREAGPHLRQPNTPPELLQGWARASLLAGQTEAACGLVREQAAAGMVSDFWPNAAAVCAALELQQSGNPAALTLAVQLLPTRTLQHDPALVMALSAVRDAVSPTLGQKGGKQWPVGALAGATLAAMPESLSADILYVLPDVALRRLRESQVLATPMRQNAALHLASITAWADDAARWYIMASSPTVPVTVGAEWPDAAVLAWAQNISLTMYVNNPSVSRVGLEKAAPHVVGAALRLGAPDVAQNWWPWWRTTAQPDALQHQHRLALELQTSQGVAAATLDAWAQIKGSDATANQRVLAVLEGMGQPVSATLWAMVVGEGLNTDAMNLAWQRLLEGAVGQRDTPGVLSMVAEALRGNPPASANPGVLKASLQALRSVGANDTAQRLAAEALTLRPRTPANARVMPLDAEEVLGGAKAKQLPRTQTQLVGPVSPTAPKMPLLPKPKL